MNQKTFTQPSVEIVVFEDCQVVMETSNGNGLTDEKEIDWED